MSDTFPDETLYPVLTSLADEDRIFASNSAAGHESSQIKGSTIKKTNTYSFHNGGEATGVPWRIHGCNGTVVLTLPAGVPIGTEIGVFVGVTVVSTVTITRAGSDIIYTPSGSASSFSVTGFGRYFTVVKTISSSWNICGLEDSAIAASLAGKAPLASPALTGTPTAPTAAAGTNTTQLATTAFVTGAVASKANDADVVKLTGNQSIGGTKTFTTSPVLPTPSAGDNTTKGATTAFVTGALGDVVKLTGNQSIGGTKTFTASPLLPTPSAGDNTTKGATTAFVTGALAGVTASSIGLGSVDNTSDINKPVSTAQAAAIAACRPKHQYVPITTASTSIAAERGNTYGVNANSCTLTLPLAGTAGYVDGDEISVVVGVSAARELAIVSPSYILRGTGLQSLNTPFNVTGFGTFISFIRSSNVWVMSYPEYALDGKAPLASPALTGTPTAPTAAAGTNTTQLATTAFVQAAVAGALSLKGAPGGPTGELLAEGRSSGLTATEMNTTQLTTDALTGDLLLTEGTPSGPTATGTKGMARFDADYFYVCTATNTWARFPKDGAWT